MFQNVGDVAIMWMIVCFGSLCAWIILCTAVRAERNQAHRAHNRRVVKQDEAALKASNRPAPRPRGRR